MRARRRWHGRMSRAITWLLTALTRRAACALTRPRRAWRAPVLRHRTTSERSLHPSPNPISQLRRYHSSASGLLVRPPTDPPAVCPLAPRRQPHSLTPRFAVCRAGVP